MYLLYILYKPQNLRKKNNHVKNFMYTTLNPSLKLTLQLIKFNKFIVVTTLSQKIY